jgi:ATP-dependent DNA ligase
MLVDESLVPFGKAGWIYELKYDGYRLIAGVQDGQVQLATKSGADATKWFPELTAGWPAFLAALTSWTARCACSMTWGAATSRPEPGAGAG